MNPHTMTKTRGTIEYVKARISADVALGTQTVAISLTPKGGAHTWLPAVWEGLAGTSRVARTQNPVSLDAAYPDRTYLVHVKVTDSPEVPVIYAGAITVR